MFVLRFHGSMGEEGILDFKMFKVGSSVLIGGTTPQL